MAATLIYLCVLFASVGLTPSTELYESQRAERVLKERGYFKEPEPEGKTIDFIKIVASEVFVEDEPYPLFLNA